MTLGAFTLTPLLTLGARLPNNQPQHQALTESIAIDRSPVTHWRHGTSTLGKKVTRTQARA